MVLYVVIFYHGMGFSRCDSVSKISFPFLDSHGVMGFSCLFELDCQRDLNLSEMDI